MLRKKVRAMIAWCDAAQRAWMARALRAEPSSFRLFCSVNSRAVLYLSRRRLLMRWRWPRPARRKDAASTSRGVTPSCPGFARGRLRRAAHPRRLGPLLAAFARAARAFARQAPEPAICESRLPGFPRLPLDDVAQLVLPISPPAGKLTLAHGPRTLRNITIALRGCIPAFLALGGCHRARLSAYRCFAPISMMRPVSARPG